MFKELQNLALGSCPLHFSRFGSAQSAGIPQRKKNGRHPIGDRLYARLFNIRPSLSALV
jgi:hypothetical protein